MKKLSAKQSTILNFIRSFSDQHGYPPSVREICASVGLSSPSTVHGHLKRLKADGYIDKDDHKTRALRLIGDDIKPQIAGVPILGRVTAGSPVLAFEENRGYIGYQPTSPGEYFALEVIGDSMVNAGIFDGDFVVVEKQSTARNGQIVVALIGDEATVKRLKLEKNSITLLPENPAYQPIPANDCVILGIVKTIIRDNVC